MLSKKSIEKILVTEDWSDLTTVQIAEVLDCKRTIIYAAIRNLRKKGIEVQYRRFERRGNQNADHERSKPQI